MTIKELINNQMKEGDVRASSFFLRKRLGDMRNKEQGTRNKKQETRNKKYGNGGVRYAN